MEPGEWERTQNRQNTRTGAQIIVTLARGSVGRRDKLRSLRTWGKLRFSLPSGHNERQSFNRQCQEVQERHTKVSKLVSGSSVVRSSDRSYTLIATN